MDLQIEQAKKEAQQVPEEERKRTENLKQESQLQEHRRISSRKIATGSSAWHSG